jgi:hypothetical protein
VASYVPNCATCEEDVDVDDDGGGKDVDEELGTTLVVVMAFLSRFVLRCRISVVNYRRESCDRYVDYLQATIIPCCVLVVVAKLLTIKNESSIFAVTFVF